MTAEERLAYFQGEKSRSTTYGTVKKERNSAAIWFKVKFFAAVVLFIAFLSLDYTGYEINGIGSERIIQEVITDFELTQIEDFAL